MALFGGEDYCLLVTLDSRTHQKIAQEYEKRFGTPLYRLGVMTEGTNVQFTLNGKPQKLEKKSFSHFKIDSK